MKTQREILNIFLKFANDPIKIRYANNYYKKYLRVNKFAFLLIQQTNMGLEPTIALSARVPYPLGQLVIRRQPVAILFDQ